MIRSAFRRFGSRQSPARWPAGQDLEQAAGRTPGQQIHRSRDGRYPNLEGPRRPRARRGSGPKIYSTLGVTIARQTERQDSDVKVSSDSKLEATKFITPVHYSSQDFRARHPSRSWLSLRFVILDNAKVFVLGASTKDAGTRRSLSYRKKTCDRSVPP